MLKATFEKQVLFPDGTLDRKKLESIIFTDESKRRKLNAIEHPAIRRAMRRQVLGYGIRGYKYCVIDAPLPIEGGLWRWGWFGCSRVLELQLQRLMSRDSSSREDALARLVPQLPISEKVTYADIVVDNFGSKFELDEHVKGRIKRLEREAGWIWRLSWLLPPLGLLSGAKTLLWRQCQYKRKVK